MRGRVRKAAGWLSSLLVALVLLTTGLASGKDAKKGVLLVVMDPLAKELACACVKGYGQRDYRKLAAQLEAGLGQNVSIEFSDDLAETVRVIGGVRDVIVIGERSKVAKGAKSAGLKCHAVSVLSDPEGGTTFSGAFVVRGTDPARELKELGGRTIFFGLTETEENHATVKQTLLKAGAGAGDKHEKRDQYTDAALDVLDSSESPSPVAVIPSYALRLMTGCGTLKPGELKVIGQTEPLPFITVFISDGLAPDKEQSILKVLDGIRRDRNLLEAMESRHGFLPIEQAKERSDVNADWPDWRGVNRDGRVGRLPERLPEKPRVLWKKAAMSGSLAGLSVSGKNLILAERDFAEEHDVYRCLDAETGELIWRVEFPAAGHLDYGQSPRATPVIRGQRVYLLGAFGELRCVSLSDGKLIWKRHLPGEFDALLPTWGLCATPLIVGDLIIVNPGGAEASIVALNCATGETRWKTPGSPAAYSAFISGKFGGKSQIIGYDEVSLGGWDVNSGKRLWQLVPPKTGDFNVPTPIVLEDGIVVATENNGTRHYRFDDLGRIIPKPVGEFDDLAPDTATPVISGGRIFGAHHGLHCLDIQQGMKRLWHKDVDGLGDFATLIADDHRVLVITVAGELILLDARADHCTIVSRSRVFDDEVEVYSHPALAGTRLFMRGGSSVVCVDLAVN